MMFLYIVIRCVAAQGGLHGVCHGNTVQTEQQVISQVATICDRDGSGILSEAEVVVGFSDILQTTRKPFCVIEKKKSKLYLLLNLHAVF